MPLDAVPESMPWGEAIRLAGLLRRDPSTWLAASVEGWEYPLSRETAAILDLFDLEHAKGVGGKRPPKPHGGRPWETDKTTKQRGNAAGRTPDEMKAILREQFGQPEPPV